MNHFRLLCAASGLCLLAACASTLQADLYQTIYASEASLTAAETASAEYAKGSFGTPSASVVSALKTYDAAAYNALHPLELDAASGASVDALKVQAAEEAVSAYASYVTSQHLSGASK